LALNLPLFLDKIFPWPIIDGNLLQCIIGRKQMRKKEEKMEKEKDGKEAFSVI
jgi:hypothetical protein